MQVSVCVSAETNKRLAFLLHVVPGVGKTATAEAVAQENKRPLFSITCGDLGIEAEDVELRTSRIFRLANLWDCVLLLDEADVFFTRRAPTDLQRSALVTSEIWPQSLRIIMVHIGFDD